jgi:hypothetical protein
VEVCRDEVDIAGQLSLRVDRIARTKCDSTWNNPPRAAQYFFELGKSKPGDVVTARVMQDVPLPSGTTIHAGSKVVGHVLCATSAKHGGHAILSLQFDRLETSSREIPISTNLRALASMMDVEAARQPTTGPDRGTSEDSWNTQQIGGDIVYRGGGPVADGLVVVGVPAPNGVLVRVSSAPGTTCRGDMSGGELQALWVFSASACGVYGYPDLTIAQAGRCDPVGQITFAASNRDFVIRGGSGLLLRVQ